MINWGYVISILGLCATVIFSTMTQARNQKQSDIAHAQQESAKSNKIDMMFEMMKDMRNEFKELRDDIAGMKSDISTLKEWRNTVEKYMEEHK